LGFSRGRIFALTDAFLSSFDLSSTTFSFPLPLPFSLTAGALAGTNFELLATVEVDVNVDVDGTTGALDAAIEDEVTGLAVLSFSLPFPLPLPFAAVPRAEDAIMRLKAFFGAPDVDVELLLLGTGTGGGAISLEEALAPPFLVVGLEATGTGGGPIAD
jgi:hypothetical protein